MILQAYDTEDVWRDKKDVKGESTFSLADLVYMSMKDREPQPESKLFGEQANQAQKEE
jgi:hypothetical protein